MNRRRYIVFVLLFVAAFLVFQYNILEPRSAFLRESISSQYVVLQKYEKLLKSRDEISRDIKEITKEMKELEAMLIEDKTEFLATAKLQELVTAYARRAGLTVLKTRPMKSLQVNNYMVLTIFYEGMGNMKQVAAFLDLIEKSTPRLKIEKMGLNIQNVQNPRELKFTIQLAGVMKS